MLPSIIFLRPNRFPSPPQPLQQVAIGLDHLVQPAAIPDHVRSTLNNTRNVFLNVTAQALPFRTASAERWQIIEVRMLVSELQKFLVIINIFLGAASEKQKETPALMAGGIGQEPVQHGTKGRDTSPGCNEDGVA